MDFIPEVKMDFIPDEEVDSETHEENPNMVYDEEEDKEKVELIIEEVKSNKDDIDPEEIFAFEKKEEPVQQTPRLTKKGKPFKKRPPMSEAHKEKLKAAREKAMLVRKTKAQERKQDKELDRKQKDLQRLKKKKEVEKLEEDVIGTKPPPKTPHNSPPQKSMDDAIMEGIMKYETIRKQRKKVKQEALKEKQEEDKVKQTLRQAINPPKPHNPFSGCY